MDIKKLDKWAELLLDTGKRNNLINFKDTKASTVEILLPSSEVLFEKLDGTTSFEVFDPKIIEEDDEGEETVDSEQLTLESLDETEMSDGKTAFLAEYFGKIRRQSQILLYNAAANPLVAVKNIDKKAREFIEETGVNVAYMAFGFIHWKENDSSNLMFRAPILLVPVQLEQASAVEPYYIKSETAADADLEGAGLWGSAPNPHASRVCHAIRASLGSARPTARCHATQITPYPLCAPSRHFRRVRRYRL